VGRSPSLAEIREYCKQQLQTFPVSPYAVTISDALLENTKI
jgi:hypothetical protein